MTKRERAQVVELLRCAADIVRKTGQPIATAKKNLGIERFTPWDHALKARAAVADGNGIPPHDGEEYRAQLLEAALRVEQGEWP